MRILAVGILSAYVKRKPQSRKHVLAFRALVSATDWRKVKDVEAQFAQVASFAPPDHVVFDFTDENLRIEMRVNWALGLARVLSIGHSADRTGRTK